MFGNHMNPQRGRHLEGGEQRPEESGDKPDIFIHGGHTIHVFHKDGTHEMHEHHGESIGDHIKGLLGENNEAEMHEEGAGEGSVSE
jgi:hypothetical protein